MDLKFYLNKFVKVDNIEHYSLKTWGELRKKYESFLEKSEGIDPDFPMMKFGGEGNGKGQKIKGVNKHQLGKDFGGDLNDLLDF